MAKLLKLSIQGIRSFGPSADDRQTITFTSPVTLILGENGCGKTTIIECLKYACTGELPGGTKAGQGFVNDPKLSAAPSTKGCVKLRISDSKGNTVVIYKAMRVDQTDKTTQKFTTLDSSIQVKKPNGEILPLSSRCADIGIQASTFMGVSKSILNNVIFCHQENSLWPLDEGKKLKEKFDDIFDSTKYNDFVIVTKKRLKDLTAKLKSQKLVLTYKKERKEEVEKLKQKLEDKEEMFNNFAEEIAANKEEMVPIVKKIDDICELENDFVKLQRLSASKQSEMTNIEKQLESIREKLDKEFEGDDKELAETIATFEENYKKQDGKICELRNIKAKLENEELTRNAAIQKCQVQLGQLQAGKKQQDEMVTERNLSIQNLAPEQYSETDMNSNDGVKNLMKSLFDSVKQSKISLDSLYDNFQEEDKKLQSNIDECLQNTIKLQQKIQSNEEQVSEIRKKNRDINSQLKRLDISDEELKRYDNKIMNIDNSLRTLNETFDAEAVSTKIEKNKLEIRRSEETLEDSDREYKLLQKNYVIENEVDTRTHDLIKRQNEIDEFRNKYYDDLKQIFEEIPKSNFKVPILKMEHSSKDKVTSLRKTLESKAKGVTKLEAKIKFEREKLQTLTEELQKSEKKVSVICENKPYESVCSEVEQNIDKLQKARGQLSSAKIMYEKFVKDFRKEKPCCPVCETDFKNNRSAVNKIVSKIESQIQDIPDELKKVEDELRKKQETSNKIQQIKPVHVRIEEIRNILIPALNDSIDTLSDKYGSEEKDLKSLNTEIIAPQKLIETCNRLIGEAAVVDQYVVEVAKLKRQLSELQSQLIKVNSGKSREQVESDISMLKINITQLRQKCDTEQKKLDQSKTKCQELREEKNKIIEKRLQLHKTMQGKPQLQDQMKELSGKVEALENETRNLQQQLEPQEEELSAAKITQIEVKIRNKDLVDEARSKHNELEKKVENIQKLQKSIELWREKDIRGQFDAALVKFNKNQSEMEILQKRKDEISEKISDLQRQQASYDFDRRKLDDNLELRKKNEQLIQLTTQMSYLNEKLGKFNYNSLQREKDKLQSQNVALQEAVHKKEGRQNEMKLAIDDLKNDLNKPDNKRAHTIYMHKLYKHEIYKSATHDLTLFVEGLENAIVEFHMEKMTKINRVIRELWRSIYRGNDIDYIEIKTEATSRTVQRVLYNYKVVQVKNNVELEMRGRCSAGQKVLACLIIRMALAEIFSHDCGILALDEPTTNLDRENILSLSEALARTINTRKTDKNFQLLVITHDEDFVKALSNAERINVHHRVKRNNNGRTVITEEAL